jgi:hypothetical protein
MATYGEASSEFSVPVIIPIPYPEDRNGLIYSIIFWGDVAAEFEILVNDEIKAGGRTSPQSRTLQLDFSAAPIGVQIGDELTVVATHYEQGLRTLKVVLLTRGT